MPRVPAIMRIALERASPSNELRACPDMRVFGPFRLDTVNHCLWRANERAPLTPKAFDVLRYLVEHADRLVTQDELLEALWTETYVNPLVALPCLSEVFP